ncbi:MAG: hypothetical protein ACKVHP_26360, partial [Verrucomicrobiales bacterium]
MNTSRYLARAFGLGGLSIILIGLVTQGRLLDAMIESMAEPSYLLSSGLMTLIIGVAIVVGHNIWDGSWRVVITVVGYLSLVKGFVILVWPEAMVKIVNGMVESGAIWGQMAFGMVFYGWMAWLGFRREKEVT